jgi:hypothetical protein
MNWLTELLLTNDTLVTTLPRVNLQNKYKLCLTIMHLIFTQPSQEYRQEILSLNTSSTYRQGLPQPVVTLSHTRKQRFEPESETHTWVPAVDHRYLLFEGLLEENPFFSYWFKAYWKLVFLLPPINFKSRFMHNEYVGPLPDRLLRKQIHMTVSLYWFMFEQILTELKHSTELMTSSYDRWGTNRQKGPPAVSNRRTVDKITSRFILRL